MCLAGILLAACAALGRAAAAPEPIVYTLRAPAPETQVLEVEARFPAAGQASIELMLPVWSPARARAACHGLEHALRAMVQAVLPLDPRTFVGWSEPIPDGGWRVGLHELVPGGAGFAAAVAERADAWLAAVADRLTRCDCLVGCPRCVFTPGCPDANRDLDRAGALQLVRLLDPAQEQPGAIAS